MTTNNMTLQPFHATRVIYHSEELPFLECV